jgi:hypothetical protein
MGCLVIVDVVLSDGELKRAFLVGPELRDVTKILGLRTSGLRGQPPIMRSS